MKRALALILLLGWAGAALAVTPLYYGIYWVDGKLLAPTGAPSVPVDGRMVVIFKTEAKLGYSADTTGAGGLSGRSGQYLISAMSDRRLEIAPGTYRIGVVKGSDNYGVNATEFTVTGRGYDSLPDLRLAYGEGIGDPSDQTGPVIKIRANGQTLLSGDYISVHPTFEATVTDDQALNNGSVKLYFDGTNYNYQITSQDATSLSLAYIPTFELEDENIRTHSISVEASDANGNASAELVDKLKVSRSAAAIIGPVLTYPQTFSPARDKTCLITYTLNKDADTNVVVYGPTGGMSWARLFGGGANGGRAGYNAVAFNGVSDTSGTVLANGIYLCRIVSGGKAIGKVFIVVYE